MPDQYRITVPLSREEFIALSKTAQDEYRHPREQARYILRSVLLGKLDSSNKNSDVPTFHGGHVATV